MVLGLFSECSRKSEAEFETHTAPFFWLFLISRIDCQVVFWQFEASTYRLHISNSKLCRSRVFSPNKPDLLWYWSPLPPIEQTDGDTHEKVLNWSSEPGICRCVCVCVCVCVCADTHLLLTSLPLSVSLIQNSPVLPGSLTVSHSDYLAENQHHDRVWTFIWVILMF